MGNHFHLMVRPGRDTNLSRLMQWIMSVFAMAFNRIHGLVGHVWGERFFSRIVPCLTDYLQLFTYIDDNPVMAHQVENRRDWIHGGLWHHRTGRQDVCDRLDGVAAWVFPEHSLIALPD